MLHFSYVIIKVDIEVAPCLLLCWFEVPLLYGGIEGINIGQQGDSIECYCVINNNMLVRSCKVFPVLQFCGELFQWFLLVVWAHHVMSFCSM